MSVANILSLLVLSATNNLERGIAIGLCLLVNNKKLLIIMWRLVIFVAIRGVY